MRQSSLATPRAPAEGPLRTRIPVEPVRGLAPTLMSRWPSTASPANGRLCFGDFVLAPDERRLTRDGVPIELGGRSFDLLLALIEQPGRIIPKRELVQRVWPDVSVEEVALRFHMTRLRKALGDGHGDRRLITTQVGVGYGFVGVITRAEARSIPPQPNDVRPKITLPSRSDRLIGRETELRALGEHAAGVGLLTISGPAGVGKTALAIEIAHDLGPGFADGATFVDLAAVPSPDMLIPAVATALGLMVAANSPISVVLDYLRDRRLLLILDTVEHLIEATASLCERIIATAPNVQILATSRQPLRARNERVHRLAPHPPSASIELFMHHVSTAGGLVDALGSDALAIAELCRRLGGLALPIEIAAIRAATHGIDATSKMLGDHLSLFWPGRRTAAPHQQTLKASLDWSFDLLSVAEREVLERVSTLDATFSLETAFAAVSDVPLDRATLAAMLDDLTDKSLILVDAGLYRCPEMIRLYACEHARALEALRSPCATALSNRVN